MHTSSSKDSTLYALVSRFEKSISKGEFALGVFLNICDVFDLVSHGAILGTLYTVGVKGNVLNLI